MALTAAGAEAVTSVFCDDSTRNVKAAQEAGIFSVLVRFLREPRAFRAQGFVSLGRALLVPVGRQRAVEVAAYFAETVSASYEYQCA